MQVIKDDIQRMIVQKSKTMFLNKGFKKTSLRDIASSCNISLGNVYNYFSSKDSIFRAVVSPSIISMYDMLERHHGKEGADIIFMKSDIYFQKTLDEYLTFILKHRELLRLLFFYSEHSSLNNFVDDFIVHSNITIKRWFNDMKSKYPYINTDFSENFLSLHSLAMFEVIKQVVKTDIYEKDVVKMLSDYIKFEIHGWKQLIGI
ncbi:MAG: TetR/AcrR family transcriptional regulator [Bacteroidales bacterium]|nr:TetR/AcrR family transcriptional regulator [Bacteroidales bacterium]